MKQVKCLLGGEKITDSHGQVQRGALVIVWITNMGYFFQVSSGQSSCFAWLWVHIWFFSGSSPVHVLLLVRWILAVRPMGRLTSPTMGVALLLFYAFIVGKVSLTWKMRNMWSLCLLSRQGSTLPHSCYYLHLWVSVHKAQSPAARPGVHLFLASVLWSLNHHRRKSQY